MAVPPCPLTLGYMVQVKGPRLYPPIGRLKADLAEWAVTGRTPPVGLVDSTVKMVNSRRRKELEPNAV